MSVCLSVCRLADEVADTPAAIRAVIRRGRCNQLRRDHPHALLLTALFVAELQRRDGGGGASSGGGSAGSGDGGAGSGDLWADVWERLSAAASNSSSRVKWIAIDRACCRSSRGSLTFWPMEELSLKHIVSRVEKLTDSMSRLVSFNPNPNPIPNPHPHPNPNPDPNPNP